jgi:hypothetical protein
LEVTGEVPSIGLFEVEKHPFFLYYISRMATSERNDVTVLVPSEMHDRIRPLYTDAEYEEIRWVVSQDGETLDDFFERVERVATNELDFLWVNTAWGTGRTPANYLEFDPDCPSVAGVTNLNDWAYNPFPGAIYRGIRPVVRLLKRAPSFVSTPVFQQLRYLMQPGIIVNHNAVNVEYPPMRHFAERHGDWGRPVYDLAPVVYEPDKLPSVAKQEGLRVAVPGRISSYIRDYESVFAAFESLFDEYGDRLTLDLVGEPRSDGESIIDTAEAFKARGFDVRYRTEWIPFADFASSLCRADLLLDPVNVYRPIRHPLRIDQETGRRNGTGVLFDAIRYAKPLLLPAAFPDDPMIAPFIRSFSSVEDLGSLVRTYLEDDSALRRLQTTATEVAAEYDVASQRQRFDALVDDVLRDVET